MVATYIYNEYKKVDEGVLTELRANAVCEKTLAIAARNLKLGEDLKFGKSERMSGGKDKDSVLADAYEALLAAIYLDSGIESAKDFIMDTIGSMIGVLLMLNWKTISLKYKVIIKSVIETEKLLSIVW